MATELMGPEVPHFCSNPEHPHHFRWGPDCDPPPTVRNAEAVPPDSTNKAGPDPMSRTCTLCGVPYSTGTCDHLLDLGDGRIVVSRSTWEGLIEDRLRLRGIERPDPAPTDGLWCEQVTRGLRCLLRPGHYGGHSMSEGNHPLDAARVLGGWR